MKRARRMLAWILVAALGLTNVDYVRAEGSSETDSKLETSVSERTVGGVEEINSAVSGTMDARDEDGIALLAESVSGSELGVTWELSADGVLTISGEKTEGKLSRPWLQYKDIITKVVVTATNIDSTANWFKDSTKITEVDLSGFDTSNVTNMAAMFSGCSSLTSLDVNNFTTHNVTDMGSMFYGCKGLTKLDVSGFDTSNVTSMIGMFNGCSGLTSLNVSGFDTSNVTNMGGMFYSCSSLTSLDVSGFTTSNVTNMGSMFYGCSSLTSLNVSSFTTGNVTNMRLMFYNCSKLMSLDISGFDTGNVRDMSRMFYLCSSLSILNVGENGLNTGSVKDMSQMFEGCTSLTNLDVSSFDTQAVTNISRMFYNCKKLTSLDVSQFKTQAVQNMSYMFYGCSALKNLSVDNFSTGNVTNMGHMFENCSSLIKLDVSKFDTQAVRDMTRMFYNCKKLTDLDVSRFSVGSVTNMSEIFAGCSSLTSLDVKGFATGNVTNMYGMFSECSSLTSLDVSGFDTRNVTNTSYMFSKCGNLSNLDVSKFNTDKVTDMRYMFSECSNLLSLDVSGFNTGNVWNMSNMFSYCGLLETLDVSGFSTGNVTNMSGMFSGCNDLISLDVSGFDTGKATDTSDMFLDCWDLENLDVSGFVTDKVKDMSYMFGGCESLTSLDVSGFATGNVTDMHSMFLDCYSLTSLDVSSFDTSKVTDMHDMFCWCGSLTSLDMSGFDISNAKYTYGMFDECFSIVKMKTFPNLTQKVYLPVRMCDEQNNIYDQFPLNLQEGIYLYADERCADLNSGSQSGVTWEISEDGVLIISGEKLAGTDAIYPQWLERKNFFTKVVINAKNIDSTNAWFYDCGGITEIDLSGFDTRDVMDMDMMFAGCSGLTSLDVSGFDTGNVMNMCDMFAGCSGLTSLDVSGFDTGNVMDMSNMFYGCSNIVQLKTFPSLTQDVVLPVRMCDEQNQVYESFPLNLPEGIYLYADENRAVLNSGSESGVTWEISEDGVLTISGEKLADTPKLSVYQQWLERKNAFTKVVITAKNIDSTAGWFEGCDNITEIDLSSFDTGTVTNMNRMFYGCSGITMLKTIPNLQKKIVLPVKMQDVNRAVYDIFPMGLAESVVLYRYEEESDFGIKWEITEDGTLVISGTKLDGAPSPTGEAWKEQKEKFTKVVITAGNIDSTAGWFEGCDNITEIDLSGFDTGKVKNMSRMFFGCSGLTNLDVSGLNIQSVTDMSDMFSGCSGITTLKTFANLQMEVALPVKMRDADGKGYESFPAKLAEGILLHGYDYGSESGVEWEITDDGVLVISGAKTEGAPSPTGANWKALKDKFTKVVVTAGNVDSTAGWFEGCDNITEIDLSGFDTGKVKNMSRMFFGCSGLTNLDVSGLDIQSVTDMSDMFSGCSGITTLKTFANLQMKVALPVKMRDADGKGYESFPTKLAEGILLHGYDYGSESGVEWEITDDGVLVISGTKLDGAPSPTGEAWKEQKEKFTKVVITAGNVDSTASWFEGCDNITEIDLSGFDAGKVKNMSRMFFGCSGLTNLDVSSLNIQSVMDMSDMFFGCSGVTKIKIFCNLQLEKAALPLPEMYDEKGGSYQWFPTGLAEGIYLYAEKSSTPPEVNPPTESQKGLRVELVHPDQTYIYNGSAIKPEIAVYNGERLLTEGTDYTVKYSNNVKAVTSATTKKKMPTITVTGKGRFTGKTSTTFTIKQCSLNDVKIGGLVKDSENTIMVASGAKASPVLVYNGMKLGTKDYVIDKANVKFTADTADKTLIISAKSNGNYKGELRLNVAVVPTTDLKKITSVTVEKETIRYDGEMHTPASITVKAGKDDITNVEGAYTIVYYGDKTTAGTQKFTVIGLGTYTGSVTKSYTIQPRTAALDVTNQLEKDGRVVCTFDGAGVTFNDKLIVKDREFNKVLEQGRDYKVTYSGNKKVGVEKAKYTITFMGNYKGNAAVKKSFTIEKAPLNNDTVTVSAVDKVYNKKGIYKSSVYVINKATGVALKSSDYKVEYFLDQEMKDKPMSKQNQVELGDADAYRTVYVKVTGKGNYEETTYATGAFTVCRKKSNTQTDISKAKITFKYVDGQKQSKVEYTGEAVYPEQIEIKISSTDTKTLKPDEKGNWDSDANFSIEFLNNIEKGKATVIIRAKDGSDYVGSKNTAFSIAPRNLGKLEDFWKNIAGLL